MTKQHRDLETILYTGNVAALKRVQVTTKSIEIGAAVTCSDAMGVIAGAYPAFGELLRRFGSVQIRNSASFGGNLCNASPCADTAPPLLVLEAQLRIVGSRGERVVPIAEFHTGPGSTRLSADEILVEVLLPPPAPTARGLFQKKGRVRVDMSIASVAMLLELEGESCSSARIAAGPDRSLSAVLVSLTVRSAMAATMDRS